MSLSSISEPYYITAWTIGDEDKIEVRKRGNKPRRLVAGKISERSRDTLPLVVTPLFEKIPSPETFGHWKLKRDFLTNMFPPLFFPAPPIFS